MTVGSTRLPVTAAWAKAGQSAQAVPHPLVCHLIDTTVVADQLYDVLLGPTVREQLETGLKPFGPPRSVVAVLCGLHDLGKLSPAFQALRHDIAIDRLPEDSKVARALNGAHQRHRATRERTDLPHGVATAAHMTRRFREVGVAGETADEIAAVIGGHHGVFPRGAEIGAAQRKIADLGGRAWSAARDELMETVAGLWDCTFELTDCAEVALPHPAGVGLAGLTTISDWIASDSDWFGPEPDVGDLAEYRIRAVQTAEKVADELRWFSWRPDDTSWSALFPEQTPNALQRAVADIVAKRDRPGIFAIEAPTGEGKSRAGLQAAATLVSQLGLSGVYVGMPTKATSRQMRAEIDTMLERQGSPLRANVVYSGAAVEKNASSPVLSDDTVGVDVPSDADDDAVGEQSEPAGGVEAREWFTKKRGLAAPIGVGTIDQALQAVIRSRHNFLRLACLSSKVLIVDEVHSYETYTSSLLDRLLWWCGRLGITVIVMSATLAATRREGLLAAWHAGRTNPTSEPVEPAVAHPGGWQLTWLDDTGRAPTREFEVSEQKPLVLRWVHERRHTPNSDSQEFGMWLRENIGHDGCAVIIHNTVPRAKDTYAQLARETKNWPGPPELFFLTGQLDGRDRARREQELQVRFGPNGQDRRGIVVGTQVLEQSLDLDFDVMVTDPCPVDLLVQRAGRLHRHQHPERAVSERLLAMVDPRPDRGATRKRDRLYRFAESTVYRQYVKSSTMEVLQAHERWHMPRAVPKLVHSVYVDELQPTDQAQLEQWQHSRIRYARTDEVDVHTGAVAALPMSLPSCSLSEFTENTTNPRRTRKSRGQQEQRP